MGLQVLAIERTPPVLDELNTAFWSGGAEGRLLIARCQDCSTWQHPPRGVCARCHSVDLVPTAVSGLGTVWSWTLNRYAWSPGIPVPYVLAEIELDEQPGLRLLSTVVGVESTEVGARVSVSFEPAGESWAPVFSPVA